MPLPSAGGQGGAGGDRHGGRSRVWGGGCPWPGGTDFGWAARRAALEPVAVM